MENWQSAHSQPEMLAIIGASILETGVIVVIAMLITGSKNLDELAQKIL